MHQLPAKRSALSLNRTIWRIANDLGGAVDGFQLPPDLFFGTTIATCVVVLTKPKKDNSVIVVDASALFTRPGNKNKLQSEHQQKILDAFTTRTEEDHFTKLVEATAVVDSNYNISVSSYVAKEDTATDITELNVPIKQIVDRQTELRNQVDTIVAELETCK